MSDNYPEILFHYTSSQSFVSMLESQEIWLSSLNDSNDRKEGEWFIENIGQRVSEDAKDSEGLSSFRDLLIQNEKVEALAFCLTENGDQLSQWRGYADGGRGVAIGFSTRSMLNDILQDDEDTKCILRKVRYLEAREEQEVKQFSQPFVELLLQGALKSTYKGLLDRRSDEEFERDKEKISRLNNNLFEQLVILSSSAYNFKHPLFNEENEWRLMKLNLMNVLKNNDDNTAFFSGLEFRESYGKIVPYFRAKYDGALPLKKVVLGPKNESRLNVVEKILDSKGYPDVEVVRSESTLR